MGLLKWCSCLKKNPTEDVRVLDFSHAHLQDVPPDVFQYERTLEELHLEANRITELPRQLFYCQELQVLYLNDNELKSIPPAINSLINLTKLDLSRNLLYTLTDNMKGLKNLKFLDLSMNGLEKLPEVVTSLISLTELYLNDTMMEFLPANFGRLVNLRILELRENTLLTLPKSIARLTSLQRIDLGQNEFTELPEVVGQLTNLTELWMDNNRIRRLPSSIGNLTKLIHVDMNNNLLSHLNPEIGEWCQLEELSVSGNELESIPSTIGQLRNLVSLKLDENQLQELPDTICQCELLEELMLSHNDLFKLPSSIGRLRRLKILTVDENFLRTLPNELSSCISLSILSVRGNKLSELPADIGHLINLRVINIVNNFVTHLPVSLLNLDNLSALWINDNQSKPLVPLQKEYGESGNIQLTCYMLPQSVGNTLPADAMPSGPALTMNPPKESTRPAGAEKRRICFANEVNGNSQESEEDENRPGEDKDSEREDLISASPVLSPSNTVEPAAVRLMRSPTPYPKDLKMLAKYVRHAGTMSNSRNSRGTSGSFDDGSPQQKVSTPLSEHEVPVLYDQQNSDHLSPVIAPPPAERMTEFRSDTTDTNSELYSSNYYESELIQMPPTITTPVTSQIKEARVTSAFANGVPYANGKPEESNMMLQESSFVQHQRLPAVDGQPAQQYTTITTEWHSTNMNHLHHNQQQDLVNNNNNNNISNIQRPNEGLPPQPPPYHIAKTYTKKSPEDLMIYDSFRNLKNQSRDMFESPMSQVSVQCALLTPTPSLGSTTNREVQQIILNGSLDENRNNLQDTESNHINGINGGGRGSEVTELGNGVDSISETIIPPPPPDSVDDIDSLSILSKESSNNASPTKTATGGGVRKSESGHSWIFGLHRNPRVLQYQIHCSNSNDVGFSVTQLPNEDGIFVSDVNPNSIANLYLKKMDKILDIDGTDFTKMGLKEAMRFLDENQCQNSAFNVMISRK